MLTEKVGSSTTEQGLVGVAVHDEAPPPRTSAESLRSFTAEAVGGKSIEDLPKDYYKNWKFIGTMVAFACAFHTSYLSYIMPAFALGTIEKELGHSVDAVWIILVWVLGQSVIYTVLGRLSDLFGRRYFYIGGSVVSLVGLIVAGSANSINTIIGGTTLTGLGTGTQLASVVVAGELVPNRHRFIVYGVLQFMFFPLTLINTSVATIAAEQATWRWVYFIPAMFGFINLVLLIFCYFPPTFKQLHTAHSKKQILMSVDFGGLVIWTGALSSLLLGFSWGGQRYPWKSYQVIATIVVGVVGMIGFVLYELFGGVKHPLMPARVIRASNYFNLVLITSAGSMTIFGTALVWPQQPTTLWGVSPTQANWMNSVICVALAGSLFGGFLGHLRNQKWILFGTCVIFTAFVGGLAGATHKTKGMGVAFMCIAMFMAGVMEALTFVAAPLMVDASDVGLANGVQFAIRSCFSSIATSIFVTALKNQIAKNLPKYVIPAAVSNGLPESQLPELFKAIQAGTASALKAVPGIDAKIIEAVGLAIKIAYEKTYMVIYLIAMAFGSCAVIASLLLRGKTLDAKLTSEVARKLQGVGRKE